MSDYSELSDEAINFEISKRLGMDYANEHHFQDFVDIGAELNWVGNANHAFRLIETLCYNFSHDAPSKSVIMRIIDLDKETDYQFVHSVHASSITRAICECWLEWQDRLPRE